MSVTDLAQRIMDCFDHDGQSIKIPELAVLLDVPESDINQAIDWLVSEGYGKSWFETTDIGEMDEELETEFDREYLEGCLDSQEEVIEVSAEWLQSVWDMAQKLMEGEG